jgi:hypothetical protein
MSRNSISVWMYLCRAPRYFKTNALRIFDTYLGAQGMEGIGELWHYLAPLLMQCGPSHVLVFIVSNRVILFLDRIYTIFPSGFGLEHSKLLCGNLLTVSFLPMFYMGESLKECEGDIFPIEEIVHIEITF